MNMQTKVYTIQFFLPPDDQLVASPQAATAQPRNPEFPKKFELPDWRGFELTENEKNRFLPPSQSLFLN